MKLITLNAEDGRCLGKAGQIAGLTGETGRVIGKGFLDRQTTGAISFVERRLVVGIVRDGHPVFQPRNGWNRLARHSVDFNHFI